VSGPALSRPPPDLPTVRFAFYALVAAIFGALDLGLAIFVIQWSRLASVTLFGVLSLLFVGTAYGLARQVIALALRHDHPLPQLDALAFGPRVAVLYATMNDVVPECLGAIRQHYPVDVYVLDDSSDPGARATVDALSARHHFEVVRREQRAGYKAGAINAWFRRCSSRYDYLVLLDSDSYLPPDWVGEALRYAEAPPNRRVAVFQGLINIWNRDTMFVQTLAPMSRVGQFLWEEQLANALDAVFCYGHNVLVRTSAVAEIGGFVEGYVSEDFATAAALAERDWHCRFIPLHTYEATPENVRGFIKRQNKWTRGAMEFFGFARRHRLGKARTFDLLQTPLGHVTSLLLPLGMFLTVYGYASTPASASLFLSTFLRHPWVTFWSVPILRYLLIVGAAATIPSVLVLRHCQISWRTYWNHRWLSAAVSMIALPYEFRSMIAYFGTRLRSIPVTPKNETPLQLGEVLYLSRYSVVLAGVLMLGIAALNPLAGVFNATWLVPMLLAPLIVWRFGGPAQPGLDVPLTEGWGEPSAHRLEPTNVRMTLSGDSEPRRSSWQPPVRE
jgi:cellulose synthase/poly-beta-1,6-N-acetylglucosamine synthase-like glycosyltransferase